MVLLKGIPMESADIVAGLSFGGITLLGGGGCRLLAVQTSHPVGGHEVGEPLAQ